MDPIPTKIASDGQENEQSAHKMHLGDPVTDSASSWERRDIDEFSKTEPVTSPKLENP
jgi:hypothetical protein